MNLKILFVGYRDKRHTNVGGYDRIIGYPLSTSLLGSQVPFGFIPVGQRGKFINLFFLNQYAKWKRLNYDIVHFFCGEMITNYKKIKDKKVVATIHMRVDENNTKKIGRLKKLDGVVALSSAQTTFLKSKGVNAVFIPHGFSKPIFEHKNINVDSNKINVVIIGTNYRDSSAILQAIDFCLKERQDVFFHLVGQTSSMKEKLLRYANARCYSRLDDDCYFSLIEKCDYNFLPLTFATANNTLLEAEFLGVKSILPKIDGVLDYAAPNPLNYFYDSIEDLKSLFLKVEKSQLSQELIEYSQKFEWKNIYSQLQSFYESLFTNKETD